MLVLTRKFGQEIMIKDDITITFLGMNGNSAKIGIEAPKEIPVHREEIYQKIKAHDECLCDK